MNKTVLVVVGLCIALSASIIGFAATTNGVKPINALQNYNSANTITFMNKKYSLKWSNPDGTGGYINEYLTGDETFDNYHTMVTIHDHPTVKNQKNAAQNLYSVFKKNVDAAKGVLAQIDIINDKSTFVRFCASVKVPKPNVECSYFNVQQRATDGAVITYQYTQRYFTDEVKITPDNFEKIFNDDFAKIKPHIYSVTMPQIVQKKIDAKASYIYYNKK